MFIQCEYFSEESPMSLNEGGSARLNWRKAMRSMNNGACVEVASTTGTVAVRDSWDLRGPVMRYTSTAWRSFVGDARTGRFDTLVP
jgi:hypothetical protein